MDFHIIIPARFASERLPGKVLREVAGKPLIQHVYERALLCQAKSITIAVDHEKVREVAEGFGAKVCMTSPHHSSGTERLAEVIKKNKLGDEEIVVNIQGDEPLMLPSAVHQAVKAMLTQPEATVTTLATLIQDQEEIFNPNIVKVVFDKIGFALYFSRAPIPWDRQEFDSSKNCYYRHIGLYAYRVKILKNYENWEQTSLENIEKLEQLRILWHQGKIHVSIIQELIPPGIDTEADLERFRSHFPLRGPRRGE